MHKKKASKLTLNRESLIRLTSSDLRGAGGGATQKCNGTADCTWSCMLSCFCTNTGTTNIC